MSETISTKLRDSEDGDILHWCPGCDSLHIINTKSPNRLGAIWSWSQLP